MKLIEYIALALGIIALTSCGSVTGNHKVAIINVENTNGMKGEISTKPNKNILENYYIDDLISSVWMFKDNNIWFSLRNKSSRTMEIIWDKAVYVNAEGVSNKVIHSGIEYKNKEKSQLPTVVVSDSKIIDYIIPADNIYFDEGKYGGWRIYNLLRTSHQSEEALLVYNKRFADAKLKVLLPLLIDNELVEYTFIFDLGEFVVQ